MIKFLHTADWQIGMTRYFLKPEAQARFSSARLDAITTMAAIASREKCQFTLVCGDVFESNHVERPLILRAFEKMRAWPDLKFYLLPGNHDPLDASSIYRSPTFTQNCPPNVSVLESTETVEVSPGVEIIAAPWPNKHPTGDLIQAACQALEPNGALRIVAGHGAVDTLSPDPNDPKLISVENLKELTSKGIIHYVALGDRHSSTDVVGSNSRIWYSGAPEPTDFDEVKPGYALVVELEADRVSVTEHPVGTWQFARRENILTSSVDIDSLEHWLSDLDNKDRTIANLRYEGQIPVAQKARLDDILDHYQEILAAITESSRSDLAVVPDDADLDHFALSGYAQDALSELQESAKEGESATTARDALALLYRLVGTEK